MKQLKIAADKIDLDQKVLQTLQSPKRVLEAEIPVEMDDGTTKT